jgi:phosphate:Na+ symporter
LSQSKAIEMTFPVSLLDLAGSIALLLWGMHMVQTGVQRTFGPRLRSILGNALKTRTRALLAGLGVTALLQSSTATGLMTAGFAAGGLIDLTPALAVMLGANIGTTLIVQVLSFDVAAITPVLILIGVLMFRRGTNPQTHDLGRAFIGLGLTLLALHQLLELMTQYEDEPSLRLLLGAVSTAPFADVVLAAGVTWAVHSSVAVVLLVMSLASRGVVPPDAAFALVLGANLGSAINPVLEGSSGSDPTAKRLAVGNLINRGVGVLLGLALLQPIGRLLVTVEPDPARAVADFHTAFNLALAIAFFPFLASYAGALKRMFPNPPALADPSQPLYLDDAAKETPIVALGAAAREALRLVDALEKMLIGAREALVQGDRRQITDIRRFDDVIDRLETAIKTYLTSLHEDDLSQTDRRRLEQILTFATNIEQAGDVVDRNLLPHAAKGSKRGLAFSKADETELVTMMDRLISNLRTAASLFMTDDPRAARLLADEKQVFRDAEAAAMRTHFERLRAGRLDPTEPSALKLDLLRDMKLINSHLVAAAAYPVLEHAGALLPTRIAMNGE